jgi:hypothetical protein
MCFGLSNQIRYARLRNLQLNWQRIPHGLVPKKFEDDVYRVLPYLRLFLPSWQKKNFLQPWDMHQCSVTY